MMTERKVSIVIAVLGCLIFSGCDASSTPQHTEPKTMTESEPNEVTPVETAASTENITQTTETGGPKLAVATLGAGCFWCVESVFLELDGVQTVESGYTGGSVENPSYELVCSGLTGHAEVCQITYDSAKIGFDELLEVFWQTHDPTTLNRQGADTGTQYRSAVFYHDEQQKELAEEYRQKLDESGAWKNPIVTEISPFTKFYKAEENHQNYFARNPDSRYCQALIPPKLEKLRKVFKDKLKDKDTADR